MTKITQKPDGTVTFELVITKDIIAKELEHALEEVAKTVSIKGFRPGKAPIKMVEAQTDKSQLYSHVLDHVLSPAYSEVIHEYKLVPLIEPRVTPKSMEEGKDWVMSVQAAIAPEIKLGDYKKTIKKIKETDKDKKLNLIFDALLDNTKFDVSPLLVEAETESALSRLASQLKSLKLSVEDYAGSIKKTTKELVEEYQKSAESNLKLEFILQKLIDTEKPEVKPEQIAELKPQKGQEAYAKYVLEKRMVLDILSAL